MSPSGHLHLLPPLVKHGKSHELIQSGQTIHSTFSPRNNTGAAFVANTEPPKPAINGHVESTEQQPIYFFGCYPPVSSDRRLFITDTFVIFTLLKNLIKDGEEKNVDWADHEEGWSRIRKLCIDHVNFTRECWTHLAKQERDMNSNTPAESEHYQILYTCFSLFVVLFLPEFGYDNAPVGEELMEWLNMHFIEPSTEEGDHLSSLGRPWEDDTFWPYLTRATLRGLSKASRFFFSALSEHPSEDLQHLSSIMATLVEAQPRLQDFSAERDFAIAFRRWRDRVKALRIEMDRVPEQDREDDIENWWDRMSDILGILEGREDVIRRVCAELGADWKEVCAAWGIFVDPRLRRDDLRDIANQVMDDLPPDPTDMEDQIHAALFGGDVVQVLERAYEFDPWLSAHLAQIVEPLIGLSSVVHENGLTLRQHYILNYGEYLRSDFGLWKVTVGYMYTCGIVGQESADEVLLRVPLRSSQPQRETMMEDEQLRSGEVVGVFQEVSETCAEHQRESVRRTVCKIAAQNLMREKFFGLAVSYCVSAEDWPSLGRIVDRVLDEYVKHGSEQFTKHASEIAPSLQDVRRHQGLDGIFARRLTFVVRYAQFHHFRQEDRHQDAALELVSMLHEGIVPKAWYAVLLCDSLEYLEGSTLFFSSHGASELLRRLEEIFLYVSHASAEEYLGILSKTKGGEEEALLCLKALRLSLARYFALVYNV